MSKPYRLITGLLLAALLVFSLSAGIVHAQCDGTVDSVECTGVDPDGWNARFVAPNAATAITVRPGARVEERITLDGGDTLIVKAGGMLAVSGTWYDFAVLDNGNDIDFRRNMIVNDGLIQSSAPSIPHFVGTAAGIHVNSDPARVINHGAIAIQGVTAIGIYGAYDQTEIINQGRIGIDAKGEWPYYIDYDVRVRGIEAMGAGTRLINTGPIAVTGQAIVGVMSHGDALQTINTGVVTAVAEHFSTGAEVDGRHSRFVNHGTISAKTTGIDDTFAYGVRISYGAVQVINTGTILAGAAHSHGLASGVDIYPGNVKVINTGLVIASGATSAGIRSVGNGQLALLNTGTISGSTASINDTHHRMTVINQGTLDGDVFLGMDDDAFIAEGGVVNGIIDGGEGDDTLTFAFAVPEDDYPAVAAQIAAASPEGGSLTYGGATYAWVNFEKIVNRLNGILSVPPIATPDTGENVEPVAPTPTPGEVIASAPAANEIVIVVPQAVCSSGDFGDGRLNGLDPAATAIVYPFGRGGIDLYTARGEWAFRAESDAVIAALAQAESSGVPVEIDARLELALYALPDGSLLATGPGYSFAFQPYECGIDL